MEDGEGVGDDDQPIAQAAVGMAGDEGQSLVIGGQDVACVLDAYFQWLAGLRQDQYFGDGVGIWSVASVDADGVPDLQCIQVAKDFTVGRVVAVEDGVARHP